MLVLQRQVKRPRFTDADRTLLAVLSQAIERSRLGQVFLIVQPATVLGCTGDSSPATGPNPRPRLPAGRPRRPTSDASCSVSPMRTRRGATGASTASSTKSATGSLHQRSGGSSATPVGHPSPTEPARRGQPRVRWVQSWTTQQATMPLACEARDAAGLEFDEEQDVEPSPKIAEARWSRSAQRCSSSSSSWSVPKKLSATELSKQSPMLPIDPSRPASRSRRPKAHEVY